MMKTLRLCGAALLAITLSACADKSDGSNQFYGDLSQSEQTKYMNALIKKMNEAPNQVSAMAVHYSGDAELGVITAYGTYSKTVTDKQLVKASAAIAKAEAASPVCFRPESMALTRFGIGVQSIVRDPNGKVLHVSELCEGDTFAPRPYDEQTEEQQAETLNKIAKNLEATANSTNLSPKSTYAIAYTSDSVKDVIYGKHSFTVKLPAKERKRVKAEYGDITISSKVCLGENITVLNKYGIRFEYRIQDIHGTDIVAPWVCPAKNADTHSPEPQFRGQTASR